MFVFFFSLYGYHRDLHVLTHSFPTRRSSDLGHNRDCGAGMPVRTRRNRDRSAFLPHLRDRLPWRPPSKSGRSIGGGARSEEHTSELQSLMRISYAVFCFKKNKRTEKHTT